MNNQDIDSLIADALSADAAGDAFREHVLRDSTAAFTRGRVLQRCLRMAGFTSLVLLVAAVAFFCGRLTVPGKVDGLQIAEQSIGERDDNVMVSRELVVWLDAARFFTQIGMEDRAALSYRQASELIPYDVPAHQQAGFELQSVLAGISPYHDSEIFGRIIAQNFGG